MPMTMADIPLHERPRERLFNRGAEALSGPELLALVIRHGRKGESALDLASALLAEYGSVGALALAHPEELARRSGVGQVKAAALVAAFHLGRLAGTAPRDGCRLRGPQDIADVARRELGGLRRERVLVLVCDAADRLRRCETVAAGAVDASVLPVREILNCVLRHDGRAFAVAHNHPSGDPTPSAADRRATRRLEDAAATVGLRFLDHIVVTSHSWACAAAP